MGNFNLFLFSLTFQLFSARLDSTAQQATVRQSMPGQGSGCGSVGRVVASNFRAKIYIEHLLSTVLKRRKLKKESGNGPFYKNVRTKGGSK